MENIHSEKKLLDRVYQVVNSTDRSQVSIILGHFPIIKHFDEKHEQWELQEGWKTWGEFSTYTFQLGCMVAHYAANQQKDVKLYILADDKSISIEEFSRFQFEDDAVPERYNKEMARYLRRNLLQKLYENRSGKKALLPIDLHTMLQKYDLSHDFIVRHDHGKTGRHDCLYFSETTLERDTRLPTTNYCARSYSELLLKHTDIANTLIVGFIPTRCMENICYIALDQIFAIHQVESNLQSAHVFMPANRNTTVENIWHSQPYLRLDMKNEKNEF